MCRQPLGARGRDHRLRQDHYNWLVHRDLASDTSTLEVVNDNGIVHLQEIDLTVENRAFEWYSSVGDDFLSARGETKHVRSLARGDWRIRTETKTVLTASRDAFRITAELDAHEGGVRVFSRNWDVSIPRDCV